MAFAWLHPILQLLVTFLSAYVAYMGVQRFLFTFCKMKSCFFAWKRHVLLGSIVLIIWFLGFLLGAGYAYLRWGAVGLTDDHFSTAMIMLPLLAVGFGTGMALRVPAKRGPTVPLVHGVCNMLLFLLSLWQIWTGWEVIEMFLLPA